MKGTAEDEQSEMGVVVENVHKSANIKNQGFHVNKQIQSKHIS